MIYSRLVGLLAQPMVRWIIISIIVILAAVLRLYRLPELTGFLADQGRDSTIVWQMVETKTPTLLGPTASIGTYHRGPAYYYLLLLPFVLSQGNPVGAAVFTALVDVGTVLLLFIVGRKFFNEWVGLAAAAIWACASFTVYIQRAFWNPNLLPFFVLLILYSLLQITQGKERYLILAALSWSIAWQLHDQALFLVPFFLLFMVAFRPRIGIRTYLSTLGVVLLSLAPFLVYEVSHQFLNTQAMIDYALNARSTSENSSLASTVSYRLSEVSRALDGLLPSGYVHPLFQALIVVGAGALLFRLRQPEKRNALLFLLWLLTPFLYAFWPGGFAWHYLAILFPIPFLLLALGIDAARRLHYLAGVAVILGIGAISLLNAVDTLSALRNTPSTPGTYYVTQQVVDKVIAEANGKPFGFKLVTPYEGFEAYESPYLYLFALRGQKPTRRADVQTFVVNDPQDFVYKTNQGENGISGVKIDRLNPPTLGLNLLTNGVFTQDQEGRISGWNLPGTGAFRIERSDEGNALVLIGTEVGDKVNATQLFSVKPQHEYVISFLYRNALGAEMQRVYFQVKDINGVGLVTLPTGGGFIVDTSKDWQDASFRVRIPENGGQAVIWLRNRGIGEAWFRDLQVREVTAND